MLASSLTICLVIPLMCMLNAEPSILSKEQRTTLQNELSPLSIEEQGTLKEFFDHHFFFSDFAYTLFGSKPMSIGRLQPTQKARDGWASWKKIKMAFNSKEFVIREYALHGNDFVLVANLNSIGQVYRQNQKLFDQIFDGKMTADALIDCIKEDGPLFQKLMHNHLLVGLLLGYGIHNAELFSQNQNLPNEKKVALSPSSGKTHPIFYIFSKVMPVSFACDPCTEETKELQSRYTKERKDIQKIAKKDPLFIQMLARLYRD